MNLAVMLPVLKREAAHQIRLQRRGSGQSKQTSDKRAHVWCANAHIEPDAMVVVPRNSLAAQGTANNALALLCAPTAAVTFTARRVRCCHHVCLDTLFEAQRD